MVISMYPYIVLNGQAQNAIPFYEHALGATVLRVQTFAEMPNQEIPEEAKKRVLHAHLKVGDMDLMLSDTFPGQPYEIGHQVTIAITIGDAKNSKELFTKLCEGGHVEMPLQKTFWSPAYGQVRDKFGVTWQVSTESE